MIGTGFYNYVEGFAEVSAFATAGGSDTARLFDNTVFFFGNASRGHGLAKGVDTVRGRHANQHIPQVTGALEIEPPEVGRNDALAGTHEQLAAELALGPGVSGFDV